MPLSACLSPPLSVCLSVSLCLCLCFSLSVSLCVSLSLSFSLSVSHSLRVSVSLSLSLSLSACLPASLFLSVCAPPPPPVSLSVSPPPAPLVLLSSVCPIICADLRGTAFVPLVPASQPPATHKTHSASWPHPQRSTGSDVRSLVGCHPSETLHCRRVTSVAFCSAYSDSTYAGHRLLRRLLTTLQYRQ